MAVVSTRTDRKRFQYLRRVAGQCRTGNRRRRTVPATEPKRAAVEIALGCTCATETRAEGEFLRSVARHQADLNVLNPAVQIGA